MTTTTLAPIRVAAKANIFADGRCVSHTLHFADGSRKTVGVILRGTLTFDTKAAEIMECVAGACEYWLDAAGAWQASCPGERFDVPANSTFEIRTDDAYHYICHYA